MSFNKKIWLLIILSSLLRIWVAVTLELGNDEVYYQTYAQYFQWNYFDHPPMVALLIRLSTFNLSFQNEFFIRLGPLLCSAAGTWLIFKIGSHARGPRTGWIAAILFNTSFYTSVIAGIFILPDSPQVVFWLLSICLMIRILERSTLNKSLLADFVLLGFSTGFCILSKIHGIFLWLGFGGYIIFQRRNLIKSPGLWISGLICIGMLYPMYRWNAGNHFISYNYHQGRIGLHHFRPDTDNLLQQLVGSVFYSNPANFILYVLMLIALVRGKIRDLPVYYPLFLWLSMPLILVLLGVSLFNETLPHWSGPAYLSLMIMSACWLDGRTDSLFVSKWLKTAGWVYVGVIILGVLSIRYLPFRIGNSEEKYLGKGDITLDMSGWQPFAVHFDSLYRSDRSAHKMKENATLISDYWFPAGHLDHYYAIPYRHNLLAFGPVFDIHHFAWLNHRRPRLDPGADAYFIYPSNYFGPPKTSLKNDFAGVEDSIRIPQLRAGKIVRYFVIYRLHGFKGDSLDYLVPQIR